MNSWGKKEEKRVGSRTLEALVQGHVVGHGGTYDPGSTPGLNAFLLRNVSIVYPLRDSCIFSTLQ